MLVGEVLVMAVFLIALVSVVACLGYLVHATVLEEHLLRNRSRTNRAPAESRRWHPGHGQTAFPMERH
jgi:hypothetical protein